MSSPPAFGPAFQVDGMLPDIEFVTADHVSLYAHRNILHHVSPNVLGNLLAVNEGRIHVPEASAAFSIALHVIYGLSCLHLPDTRLDTVESAIGVLITYGVPVQKFAAPNLPLYQLIFSHAPYRPIDAYALAAHHGLEPLAVAVSAHLLAYDTSNLTDELSLKMGPIYIKRLFDLHQTRRDALRNIMMKPPAMHAPNLVCGLEEQRQLTQVWAFAAAEMAWNMVPGTSTYMLQSTFEKVGRDMTCGECRLMLHTRIQEAIEEWSLVPRTI
ncbi:hypothetical protein L227DRAFT_556885 [Lentinus tigrinus ALCF2SS1-6]|uniref:BTB domain-containing protein n=1 Tax=Lentinus tigrinus ALCF2SS1-6 TaxID=1328759 RepID=A0A5C2RR85_9APHY|nr:hypothetical protein L227DRAFT_556885 [Lentinus tigrinus ALCF2SS1-6]